MTDPNRYVQQKEEPHIALIILIIVSVVLVPVAILFLFDLYGKRKTMAQYAKMTSTAAICVFCYFFLASVYAIRRNWELHNGVPDHWVFYVTVAVFLLCGAIIGILLWKHAKKWKKLSEQYPPMMSKYEYKFMQRDLAYRTE